MGRPGENPFRDRVEAGRLLAAKLAPYGQGGEAVVLGLPRGGVPVAYEVAKVLVAPLDVFLVRKLGLPGHEEYAIGAIASGGVRVVNPEAISKLSVNSSLLDSLAAEETRELERREKMYRGNRPLVPLSGRRVILIDDGLATGSTMRAAVAAVRQYHPSKVAVAVPVAPPETCREIAREIDELVCLRQPDPFYAVGLWYEHFPQVSDAEVCRILQQAAEECAGALTPPR